MTAIQAQDTAKTVRFAGVSVPPLGLVHSDGESSVSPLAKQGTDPKRGRMGALSADERETIIRLSDGEGTVNVWTARRTDIARFRKNPDATETGTGFHGNTEWAEFTIPKDRWNSAGGIKARRKPLSEAQRHQAAERLRLARKNRAVT